jgi:hypothetical protein
MQGQLLCSQQLAVTTSVTVYTVPASTAVKIMHGVLCNTGAVAAVVSVALIPSGGTADGTHRVISGYNLNAGDSLSLAEYLANAMLAPGDFISAQSSVANAVDIILSGVVAT